LITFIILLLIVSILLFLRIKYLYLYKRITFIASVTIVFVMVFFIAVYPTEIIEATRSGITLWANVVLPSLLPFFIGAELLVGLGVVKFIGVLIEPLIRPIFNVPGEASFVFAMSITSGYPMGIKLTSNLRKNNLISRSEAQRMVSFCSTSGPLFMIGAIAIGMFNSPKAGPYIVAAHYLGAITIGLIFRYFNLDEQSNYSKSYDKSNIFKKAFKEMQKERLKDGRRIGKLLGDSVKESISTLVLVGGMIVTFSVLIRELYLIGFVGNIVSATKFIAKNSIQIPSGMIEAILTGSIEMTMGCKITSEAMALSPVSQITIATMIISWSGFSVHAQAASIINDTDISLSSYVASKFFHSIISGIYVYSFLTISNFSIDTNQIEVFSKEIENINNYTWVNRLIFSTNMFLIILFTLIAIGFLMGVLKKS